MKRSSTSRVAVHLLASRPQLFSQSQTAKSSRPAPRRCRADATSNGGNHVGPTNSSPWPKTVPRRQVDFKYKKNQRTLPKIVDTSPCCDYDRISRGLRIKHRARFWQGHAQTVDAKTSKTKAK